MIDPAALPESKLCARAAQYLRMSTDRQKYSIQNQAEVTFEYADQHGLTIVRRYEDAGRSGLTINGRAGLKELIDDVRSGRSNFGHILIYDVSRWGRFQDVDESAYYEFICRRAGIRLHYCSDEFDNDGSLSSTILKNVKRLMAGDYSRQLSRRIFLAQCRMTESGLWHGGSAAYGLRRHLVDPNGRPLNSLERGQRKSISSDRVLLRPGPESEVTVVHRIFESLVSDGKTYTEIADDLNGHGVLNGRGARWTSQAITKILTNEAYIGNVVYNRTSFKLKQKATVNPPSMWIRHDKAHEGLISREVYDRAQTIIEKRRAGHSDADLLDKLRGLYRKHKKLSIRIVHAASDVPYPSVYKKRFGSLRAAFELAGFKAKRSYRWMKTDAAIDSILETIIADAIVNIGKLGAVASFDAKSRLLAIGSYLTVTVGSARCFSQGVRQKRWHVRVNKRADTDFTLIFKMNASNTCVGEYCCIPSAELAAARVSRLRMSNPIFLKATRHENLEAFYVICAERIGDRDGSLIERESTSGRALPTKPERRRERRKANPPKGRGALERR